jgi:hypothetical protein
VPVIEKRVEPYFSMVAADISFPAGRIRKWRAKLRRRYVVDNTASLRTGGDSRCRDSGIARGGASAREYGGHERKVSFFLHGAKHASSNPAGDTNYGEIRLPLVHAPECVEYSASGPVRLWPRRLWIRHGGTDISAGFRELSLPNPSTRGTYTGEGGHKWP